MIIGKIKKILNKRNFFYSKQYLKLPELKYTEVLKVPYMIIKTFKKNDFCLIFTLLKCIEGGK